MGELRKDYILDRWVIIATERAKRPHQFKKEKAKEEKQHCFFCPGHEDETPPETFRIEEKGKWKIRVFPNKFAAVKPEGNAEIRTDNKYFTFSDNYGAHEVLVETNNHKKQLSDLSIKQLKQVLDVYCLRIKELSKINGVKYVQVFKNHGKEAGTSIVHSHSQIIAYNKVPEVVEQEVNVSKNYGGCPYCEIIETEKNSHRRCFENDSFLAFTPYASRFPFEIWIFPKNHVKSITELDDKALNDLASVMRPILLKLKELNASFNYVLHYAPEGEDLHFHIELMPRLATWAGFEFNGTVINIQSPEEAAKFYRGEE
ncbi:galactose-1-phosphate uridylyltransferase [Candidatus Woesearchaeota archaeon]|nr:galactose-1-phosphate uridylyltransferase [Candidatus Woesearchaeota archaeon]